MITYVDTSTLLKLIVEEDGSDRASLIWDGAEWLTSASLVVVEGRAALAAAQRAGRLSRPKLGRAKAGLVELVGEMSLVEITHEVVELAADLAEQEQLRGYDAVHLAAALTVEADLVTSADTSLCDAAARHGMHVANPLER